MIRISIVFLDLFFKRKRPQIEHDVEDDVIKLTTKFNHGCSVSSVARVTRSADLGPGAGDGHCRQGGAHQRNTVKGLGTSYGCGKKHG